MYRCEICEHVFGPKAIAAGVNQLQTFNGYTVDFRLQQFRSIPREGEPEFIDFDSLLGLQLRSDMHEAAMKQLSKKFAKFAM
jgi:hypothetical protein